MTCKNSNSPLEGAQEPPPGDRCVSFYPSAQWLILGATGKSAHVPMGGGAKRKSYEED